jgi:hypothetical protein
MPTEALTTKAIEFGAIHAYQFDEASGDLLDFVGSNDGTISGTPDRELSDGYGNGASAYGFDGSTDYITLGSNILNGASAYTIEAVIKKPAVAASEIVFSERDGASDGPALFLDASERFTFRHNATSITGSPIAADEVVHVQGTWDGSTLRLYVNGELQESDSDATAVSTTTVGRIGCRSTAVSLLLTGNIAHLAIYDSALSQAQINELVLTARPPLLRYQLDLSASAADSALTDYATRVGTASISTAQNTAIMSTDTGNGADVWFSSDEAGTLPIDAKLVYWDDSTSKFAFDVEITSVSAVSGATIYLHVGSKPGGYGDDPYPVTAEGVYPLADSLDDQTSNGNDLTAFNGLTVGSGGSGPDGNIPATDFDHLSSQTAYASISGGGSATVTGWFKTSNLDGNRHLFTWANFAAIGNYFTARAAGASSGDPVDASSRNTTLNNVPTTTGYSADTWHHFAARVDSSGNLSVFIDAGSEGNASGQDLTVGLDNFEIGALARSSTHAQGGAFNGELALIRVDSTDRSDAEINADYLLQGSTASSYWTVTDVTPGLPEATFDLRSDRDVVLSGSDVTSWGNASGGTSPTYSDDPADKVLGFPAIQFDASSSQYLEWDEIASMFSGDNPDFTAAMLFLPRSTGTGTRMFASVDAASKGRDSFVRLNGSNDVIASRRDAETTPSETLMEYASVITTDTPYLAIVKQSGTTRSGLLHRISDGVEESNSDTVDVASTTMTLGTVGADRINGNPGSFSEGDIFRIRLYNTALGGDLTGDLTGTQLGQLKDEMLLQAAGDRSRTRRRGRRRYW